MPRQFPPEFRQRALRMLEEALPEHETEYAAIRHVGGKLGVGAETLRKWRRRGPQIRTADPNLAAVLDRSIEDLGALRIFDPAHPRRPVVAAGAERWRNTPDAGALLGENNSEPQADWLTARTVYQ